MELERANILLYKLKEILDQYAAVSNNTEQKNEWEDYIRSIERFIELKMDIEIYLETRQERYDELVKMQSESLSSPDQLINMGERMQIVEDMSLLKRRAGVWNNVEIH